MDIRTKLAIALVSVSLLSMLALGFFAYQASAALLQDMTERQLGALAETKARDVSNIISAWRDRVSLVASRTQLRTDLSSLALTSTEDAVRRNRINRIIIDAQSSTPSVAALALYDASGKRLIVSGLEHLVSAERHDIPGAIQYDGITAIDDENYAHFIAPLTLDRVQIGSLELAFTSDDLRTVTNDYTGLGESGETIILHRSDSDEIAILHPLRHETAIESVLQTEAVLFQAALDGVEQIFTAQQTGYRGTFVWAATRFIEEVNWGLIVQVDQSEELIPVDSFRSSLIDLGIALSAFAVFGGSLLGIYLARPLRRLADTVNRVSMGETNLRADASGEDEVGLVAKAFNDFLEKDKSGPDADP